MCRGMGVFFFFFFPFGFDFQFGANQLGSLLGFYEEVQKFQQAVVPSLPLDGYKRLRHNQKGELLTKNHQWDPFDSSSLF